MPGLENLDLTKLADKKYIKLKKTYIYMEDVDMKFSHQTKLISLLNMHFPN